MKKISTIILILLLVVSFFATAFFLYDKSQDKTATYHTDSLFVADIIKKTVASGSISPRKEIDVKSQVSGIVEKLHLEAGDLVKAGQVIAKIKIIPDVLAVNNAQARVKNAMINFKDDEQEYKRRKKLFEQKVISEVEFNQHLLNYNISKQQLEAAENNLELVIEGASKSSGNISNLVKATATGMVLSIPVKEGGFVIESNTFNEGTTIASIANMNEMVFEGKVDEAEVGKIKMGMNLILKVAALENESFDAKLEFIAPKGVEEEGAVQFEIKAAIALKEASFLRAGYSANADIVLEKREKVLVIKESNLIFEDKKRYAEVMVGEQEFEKRELKTGLSNGVIIEVVSGLDKNSKVKQL